MKNQLNPKEPRLLGGVFFGDMKSIFTEFYFHSFKWSILYKSWDDQLPFDSLVNDLNFLKLFWWKILQIRFLFHLIIAFGSIFFWLGCDAQKVDDQFQRPLWPYGIFLISSENWKQFQKMTTLKVIVS